MTDLKLEAQLIRDEGEKFKLYKCTAGKLTIGVGHNIEDLGLSKAASRFILQEDIGNCEKDLDKSCPWWRTLNEARRRALVNMCFNLGITRLLGFRNFLSALKTGDYPKAAKEAQDSAWFRQVGARAQRIVDSIRTGTD